MDLSVFLQPVNKNDFTNSDRDHNQLLENTTFYAADTAIEKGDYQLAIIGVAEDRMSFENSGCGKGLEKFRKAFYPLYKQDKDLKIIDLGDVLPGNTVNDTYFALRNIIEVLIKLEIVPIIIGGSQDLTYANYLAYEKLEQTINLVTIDHRLDFGPEEEKHSRNYLNDIVLHQPNFLFNYGNIGHQRPFVDQSLIDLMEHMHFDLIRLGELHSDITKAEPAIRNADVLSIDMAAIRKSAAKSSPHSGPNGLDAQQVCQLCWYAGMSDKLNSFGIYEYNPNEDTDGSGADVLAQMVWYFMDGFASRKRDYPFADLNDYYKYIVALKESEHQIIFYKSNKSDRWWMDVPYPAGMKNRYERHHLIPCTYADYQQASNEEVPDLWWRTYQKLT